MKPTEIAGGTILIGDDNQPVLVTLAMRPATTSPTRIKAVLAVECDIDDHVHLIPMPFAAPIVAVGPPNGFTPEFRLEMN